MNEPEKMMNRKQKNWAIEAVPYLAYTAIILWTVVLLRESGIDVMSVANSALNHVASALSDVGDRVSQLADGLSNELSIDLYTTWLKGQNPGIEIADSLSRTNPDLIANAQNMFGMDAINNAAQGIFSK